MPDSPEQSTSTSVPSAGTPSANSVAITHGTWYSRLTIPMWLAGVPERQMTAVSSSKIGARNVAPASATPATTPSADESMSSSTSSGVLSMRQVPRTGAESRAFVPVPSVVVMTVRDPTAIPVAGRANLPSVDELSDASTSDDDLVLHELRVRGTAADEGAVADRLVDAGFAIRRRSLLMLTPAGRAEADVRFCVTGTPAEEFVQAAYARFGPLNRTLIQICNDWQVRAGEVPNDHRDPVYDWGVIDRLVAHDQQTGPVVRSLGRQVSRFAQYRDRLRGARRLVEAEEHDWLLSPRIDSYHTVWMQLHEDLLLGLGVDRADEVRDDQ